MIHGNCKNTKVTQAETNWNPYPETSSRTQVPAEVSDPLTGVTGACKLSAVGGETQNFHLRAKLSVHLIFLKHVSYLKFYPTFGSTQMSKDGQIHHWCSQTVPGAASGKLVVWIPRIFPSLKKVPMWNQRYCHRKEHRVQLTCSVVGTCVKLYIYTCTYIYIYTYLNPKCTKMND